MKHKTIVVLGGGVGGLVAANELRQRLPPEHRIILVDRYAQHLHNPSLLWLMLGWRQPAQIQSDLHQLTQRNIEFVQADIQGIAPANHVVQTTAGELRGDYLIIALGAQPALESTPGLAEAAHTPYTLQGATRLRDALREFGGGRLVVAVTGLPYRCPAAPYETAIMIHSYLEQRGLLDRTEMRMISPEAMPMGTAGPAMATAVEEMLSERNIMYQPLTATQAVDTEARELVLESDERVPFDLLAAVPAHHSPQVIRDTDLANEAGWVPVDARTLATRYEGVYAVGDVTVIPLPGRFKSDVPLVLPKAGVFAHRQAEVVAHNLAAEILGHAERRSFDGFGGCFIELGDGRAGYGEGDFYDESAPSVTLRGPARRWHWAKVLVEKYWLRRWFARGPRSLYALGDRVLFG